MPAVVIGPLAVLLHAAGRRLDRWSVESQLGARRNAMVASTALAQRRAEREEVEEYFAALAAPPAARVHAHG